MLLLDLYVHSEARPSEDLVERLRDDLRDFAERSSAPSRRRASRDPGFRSSGSIWSHVSVLRSVDQGRLPLGAAPTRLRRPWRLYRHETDELATAASVIRRQISEKDSSPAMPARPEEASAAGEIRRFLHEAHELLDDVVRTVQRLPHFEVENQAVEALVAAWEDLQRRSLLEELDESLSEPDVGIGLERAGLTGAQLALKLGGWRRAVAEWFAARTARSLRWALGHANTILGSLTTVIPGPAIEMYKEFKEATETTIDEVVPTGGYLPAPTLA